MERHTIVGEQILAPVEFLAGVRAARAPRARALGRRGLPRPPRRRGDPARLADHPRLRRAARDDLRPAVPPGARARDARRELRRHAGTQFDPRVVRARRRAPGRRAGRGRRDGPGRPPGPRCCPDRARVRVWSRPWARTSPRPSSAARTASATARRSSAASTSSRACSRESRFDAERRSIGLEIELNLTDEAGDPALRQRRTCSSVIADADFQTELAQFNIEINIPPRLLEGDGVRRARGEVRASLNHAEEKARTAGAHMMMVGHPADARRGAPQRPRRFSANPRYKLLNEQIFAARGEDLQHRRSPASSGCRRSPTRSRPRRRARACSCTSWSIPTRFARALERRAGDRRRPARGRRQLAVLLRPRAVAGDADRAVRAGDGHAPGGAQGPGRAPARVVRRALDHLDLRPLRGERPLLPGAAAGGRGRGPGRGARARRRARGCRSCGSTTARSTAGTGRSTTSCAAARTCGWRTACCPPARPSSTRSPTPPSTTGSCACWSRSDRPIWTQMSFSAAEENFHAGARDGHRRARVLAGRRRGAGAPSSSCAGCCRSPTRGSTRWGVDPRDARPAARDHRAPLRRGGATARSWQAATFHRLYETRLDRAEALREMTVRYREHMHSNEPVHTWPVE